MVETSFLKLNFLFLFFLGILPPSNKSLTIWLSFSILFLHFVQSCILIDEHIGMRDSLLFLAFLQLFFGFIHFYSTTMFHVASNVIQDSMLWWWKWFLISEIFWIASKTFLL